MSENLARGGADGDVLVVAVGGELDYAATPRVRDLLLGRIRAGTRVVVDLSEVTFIDSTAIGALIAAVTRLRQLGGAALAVVCARENERVLRIFDIAGVASLIPLYRSREQAFAALAAPYGADADAQLVGAAAPTGTNPGSGSSAMGCPCSDTPAVSVVACYARQAAAVSDGARGAEAAGRAFDELV